MLRSLLISHTRRQLERKRSVLAIFGAVLGGVAGLLITGGLAMVAQASERARTAAAGLLFVGLGLLALAGAVVMTIIARSRNPASHSSCSSRSVLGMNHRCSTASTPNCVSSVTTSAPSAVGISSHAW